jgi:transcriptional regulator GlxA family with amidase domain
MTVPVHHTDNYLSISPARTQRTQLHTVDELLPVLLPWLERMPLALREAAEAVIETPECFFDAEDVAARARLSRRHVDRLFGNYGLAPAKHLVIACRAYATVRLLSEERSSIASAAGAVGYDGQRGIRRHCESVWGVAPKVAAQLTKEELLKGVVDYVTREPTNSSDAPSGPE